MDTLPLPPRANLEQYKKRAKSLAAAAHSTDPSAVRSAIREWIESLVANLDVDVTPFVRNSIDRAVDHIEARIAAKRESSNRFTLADAQFLIAEAHGFESWAAFARHLRHEVEGSDADRLFERAADAVVSGDSGTLTSLLRDHPELIRQRSSRVHHVTLLHYVAANGVEDFRQTTPENAVEITRLLLDAGAEPDAVANTYGGGTYQTTMNLLVSSTHPAAAGLQSAIAEVLIDYGAAVNGAADDESPMMTALDFGYIDAAETLARRGARVDTVVAAAALGRAELVAGMVVDARTLKPDVPLIAPAWVHRAMNAQSHIELAFAWACKFRREDVARFLLRAGVDVAARDSHKMTPLHWAAANGMMAVVNELLERSAPLDAENMWGGNLLSSTLHFALYIPVPGVDYPAVIEKLLRAGADVHLADFPTGNTAIDSVLGRFGAGKH